MYQMVTLFAQLLTFDFHIVNFLNLSGNIPTAPAYATDVPQLIRYSWACHNYDNFSSQHSMLAGGPGFFYEKTDENIPQIYG